MEIVGDIKGAKPKEQYYRTNPEEIDKSLKCRDILGNNPGATRVGAFHTRERKDVRPVGRNDDIDGTQAGTKIVGIKVPEG